MHAGLYIPVYVCTYAPAYFVVRTFVRMCVCMYVVKKAHNLICYVFCVAYPYALSDIALDKLV